MLRKTLNLVKEQRRYGLFFVRGFIFGDKFVKIVSNFEIKCFIHCLIAFVFQRSLVDCLLAQPYFLNHSKQT
jgi:hypothetical protein